MEIAFASNIWHAKFQNFLPLRPNYDGPSGETKTSKSYNFLQYSSEKLIWTLFQWVAKTGTLIEWEIQRFQETHQPDLDILDILGYNLGFNGKTLIIGKLDMLGILQVPRPTKRSFFARYQVQCQKWDILFCQAYSGHPKYIKFGHNKYTVLGTLNCVCHKSTKESADFLLSS